MQMGVRVCAYVPVMREIKCKTKIKKYWEELGQCLKGTENVRRV